MTSLPIKREVNRAILAHMLKSGRGGLLLISYVVLSGIFGVVKIALGINLAHFFFFEFLVTAIFSVFGYMVYKEYQEDEELVRKMLHQVLEKKFLTINISDIGLLNDLKDSIKYLQDITIKIMKITAEAYNEHYYEILKDAFEMMRIQQDAAWKAIEYKEVLDKVNADNKKGKYRDGLLFDQNVELIKQEKNDSLSLVGEINQKMRIMLMQITQLEKSAGHETSAALCAKETSDTLKNLQGILSIRKEGVDKVRQLIDN